MTTHTSNGKKQLIIFNGVHGAGKTTLARMLGSESGFSYFEEVGGLLRKQVLYNVLQSGEEFDRMIIAEEFKRDDEVLHSQKVPVIETWHPGNLAYIMERSPQLYDVYAAQLAAALERFAPFAILLSIEEPVFYSRITEKIQPGQERQLLEYYKRVYANTLQIYRDFRIEYTVIPNNIDKTAALMEAKALWLQGQGMNNQPDLGFTTF